MGPLPVSSGDERHAGSLRQDSHLHMGRGSLPLFHKPQLCHHEPGSSEGLWLWAKHLGDDRLQIQGGLIKDYIETDRDCPIAKPGRVAISKDATLAKTVTMNYHDIDVNGHVNSVKYIEHVLDLFGLDWYRSHRVKRFDIAYVAESHAGDELCFFMEKAAAKDENDEEPC